MPISPGACRLFRQHLRQTRARKVPDKILFAGIIGVGCAIGSAKMAQISTSVGAAELDSEKRGEPRLALDRLSDAPGAREKQGAKERRQGVGLNKTGAPGGEIFRLV